MSSYDLTGADYLSARSSADVSHWEATASPARFFVPKNLNQSSYESESICEAPLRIMSHREAQKRGSRHLQERAAQAAPGLVRI